MPVIDPDGFNIPDKPEYFPAERIAELCGGTLRNGRAMVRCPNAEQHKHQDRSASCSIKDGRDHRALIHCFSGCPISAILKKLDLTLRDLFPNRAPITPEQRREIARREKQKQDWEDAEKLAARRVRDFTRILEELGYRLAKLPANDPRERELTRLYHFTLDRLRQNEEQLHELTKGGRQ